MHTSLGTSLTALEENLKTIVNTKWRWLNDSHCSNITPMFWGLHRLAKVLQIQFNIWLRLRLPMESMYPVSSMLRWEGCFGFILYENRKHILLARSTNFKLNLIINLFCINDWRVNLDNCDTKVLPMKPNWNCWFYFYFTFIFFYSFSFLLFLYIYYWWFTFYYAAYCY